jgi:light-independent protochlorophyllide reductase subunit B
MVLEAVITDDYLTIEQKVTELSSRPSPWAHKWSAILLSEWASHVQLYRHLSTYKTSQLVMLLKWALRVQMLYLIHGLHLLMMGLEEHLLTMFREDFEFHLDAPASRLGQARAPKMSYLFITNLVSKKQKYQRKTTHNQ